MAAPVERMAHEQNTPFLQCAELVEFHWWLQDRAADRGLWASGLCVCANCHVGVQDGASRAGIQGTPPSQLLSMVPRTHNRPLLLEASPPLLSQVSKLSPTFPYCSPKCLSLTTGNPLILFKLTPGSHTHVGNLSSGKKGGP